MKKNIWLEGITGVVVWDALFFINEAAIRVNPP